MLSRRTTTRPPKSRRDAQRRRSPRRRAPAPRDDVQPPVGGAVPRPVVVRAGRAATAAGSSVLPSSGRPDPLGGAQARRRRPGVGRPAPPRSGLSAPRVSSAGMPRAPAATPADRRGVRSLAPGGQRRLGDAVLERVVGQDDDAAADREGGDRARERPLPRGELAVDLDPQGLEGALGRVPTAALRGRRDGPAEQLDEARRGRERRASRAPGRPRRRWSRANRSSPYSRRIRVRSSAAYVLSTSAAVRPLLLVHAHVQAGRPGRRRSRARPRRAGATTRRGRRGRPGPGVDAPARRAPRGSRRRRRGPDGTGRRTGRAARRPGRAPPGPGRSRPPSPTGSAASSASVCPPIPSVASTQTDPGASSAGARRSTTRSRSTGTCRSAAGPRVGIVTGSSRVGGLGWTAAPGDRSPPDQGPARGKSRREPSSAGGRRPGARRSVRVAGGAAGGRRGRPLTSVQG